MTSRRYFRNEEDAGGEWHRLRPAWHDAQSFSYLEALGVGPGWRCLELYAERGEIEAAEIDDMLSSWADPTFEGWGRHIVYAWGRKPA